MLKRNGNKGFSLMELLVVVAMISVLIALLAPTYLSLTKNMAKKKDENKLTAICVAFKTAMTDENVKIEMEDVYNNSEIKIYCKIDAKGNVSFKNGTINKNDGILSNTKLWECMRQSIENKYTFEDTKSFGKYVVFTLTPKTPTTTAQCIYKIVDAREVENVGS